MRKTIQGFRWLISMGSACGDDQVPQKVRGTISWLSGAAL